MILLLKVRIVWRRWRNVWIMRCQHQKLCSQSMQEFVLLSLNINTFRKFSDSVKRKLFPQGGDDCKKQYQMCTQEITFWWAPWKQTCPTEPVFTLFYFCHKIINISMSVNLTKVCRLWQGTTGANKMLKIKY